MALEEVERKMEELAKEVAEVLSRPKTTKELKVESIKRIIAKAIYDGLLRCECGRNEIGWLCCKKPLWERDSELELVKRAGFSKDLYEVYTRVIIPLARERSNRRVSRKEVEQEAWKRLGFRCGLRELRELERAGHIKLGKDPKTKRLVIHLEHIREVA